MTPLRASSAIAILCALLSAGCTREPAAVPRRTAYPRVTALDTARHTVGADTLPGIHFSVNTSAALTSARPGWLDIRYPSYGATVHLTLTDATGDDLAHARANRLQRLSLNLGDAPGSRVEWLSPHGFDILEVYAAESAFPYQFLATDGNRYLLSGALRFDDPHAVSRTDSIRPMIDAIAADIHLALASARPSR